MCATRKSLSLSSGLPLVVGLSMAVALLATGAWWAWGGGLSLNAPVG